MSAILSAVTLFAAPICLCLCRLFKFKRDAIHDWLDSVVEARGAVLKRKALACRQLVSVHPGGSHIDDARESGLLRIGLLYPLPIGPLIDRAVAILVDSGAGLYAIDPGAGADEVGRSLDDHIELAFGESHTRVGVKAFSNFARPLEFLVQIVGMETRHSHGLVVIGRIVVAKQVIMTSHFNERPVSVGILLGFVNLIFERIAIVRSLLGRVSVSTRLPRCLGSMIYRRRMLSVLKTLDAIRTRNPSGERRIPSILLGVDGTPVLVDHVKRAVFITKDTGVRTVRRI